MHITSDKEYHEILYFNVIKDNALWREAKLKKHQESFELKM